MHQKRGQMGIYHKSIEQHHCQFCPVGYTSTAQQCYAHARFERWTFQMAQKKRERSCQSERVDGDSCSNQLINSLWFRWASYWVAVKCCRFASWYRMKEKIECTHLAFARRNLVLKTRRFELTVWPVVDFFFSFDRRLSSSRDTQVIHRLACSY